MGLATVPRFRLADGGDELTMTMSILPNFRKRPREISIGSVDELQGPREWNEQIASRRYGVIQVRSGTKTTLRFRSFPKVVSIWHVLWGRVWTHDRRSGDCCELYYDAPSHCPDFVVIKWMLSHRNTTFHTTRTAMKTLDEIARIRQARAIVFHASNDRITDRVMERFGYERHAMHLRGRHYIKRFTLEQLVLCDS